MSIASKFRALRRVERAFDAQFIASRGDLRVTMEEPDFETFKPSTQLLHRTENGISCSQVDPQVKMSIFSPQGREFRVVEKADEKLVLEVWIAGQLEQRKFVEKAFGKDVYGGGVFGAPRWSNDETKVAFIAEKKKTEYNNFWANEQSEEKAKPQAKFRRDIGAGGNDFGELNTTKKDPVLCVYDVIKNEITVASPSLFPEFVFPCHPVWAPDDSLVCCSYDLRDVAGRIGLSACLNRKTTMHHIKDIKEGPLIPLAEDFFLSLAPRFSPDGSMLIFYTHKDYFLGHATQLTLSKMAWPACDKVETVVDNLWGYHDDLAKCAFVNDSIVAVSTARLDETQVGLVDIKKKELTLLGDILGELKGSISLLSVTKDRIAVSCSDYRNLTSLWTVTIGDGKPVAVEEAIRPAPAARIPEAPELLEVLKKTEVHRLVLDNKAEGTLLLPKGSEKAPLVILIHGGPHSHSPNGFSIIRALFRSLGYACLIPNYRGSIGLTKAFCEELIGNAGEMDAEDCELLTKKALEAYKDRLNGKTVAYGGSHGGFLTGMLLGRNKIKLEGGVLWNPVTNLIAMMGSTEIPEWCTAEALGVRGRRTFTDGDIRRLWDRSPISKAHEVVAPVLMVLGASDRRVPPINGREYVQALSKLEHSQISVLEFPNEGHGLKGNEAQFYAVVQICEWIAERFEEKKTEEKDI